ncbi:ABC transporter substrate-binding protein [Brenneria tiliae]|uniref:ABC transporter substrate-binding protein n=1 Tax=Brenneria tiliae TaxID=2914984 RepID=A0ABT0N1X8_9GAMM|nr:ABC transporter substrate-binding protein [Brenneria tiliae]MCL2895807.1 ABC transporter substrate-binding protein [Brenneria tiliae]
MTTFLHKLPRLLLLGAVLPLIGAFSQPADAAEIRLSWWGGNQRHEATLAAINAFQRANPSITVKAEYAGWDGYLSRLSTQMAGGQEPDVMRIDWNWLPQFSRNGEGFYDLNRQQGALTLQNFPPQYLKMGDVKGKLQGVPISMTSRTLIYNRGTWQKAGVAYPKTWDELFAAGLAFKQKLGNNYYPLGVAQGAGDSLDILALARSYMAQKYGIDLIDEQKRGLAYSREQVYELFRFYQKLVDSHVIPDQRYFSSFGRTNVYEIRPWINGELAGMYLWDSSIYTYSSNMPQEAVLEPGPFITLPAAKDSGMTTKPSSLFAVSKHTRHPREAAQLINFLLNDAQGIKALGLQNGMPITLQAQKLLEDIGVINPQNVLANAYRAAAAQPESQVVVSPFMENQELVQLWTNSVQKLDYGKGNLQEIADDFLSGANRILKRAIR